MVGVPRHIFSVKMLFNGKFLLLLWQLEKKCKSFRKNKIQSFVFYNLHSANERLAEARTDLLAKERQNQFLSTALRRPVLEPPRVGSLNTKLLLSGNPAPRENVVIPKSTAQASNESLEAYCTKAQAAAQENLDPLNEYNNISIRSQMGLGSKGLESELSKVKTSQDSCEVELKTYKQTYLEEQKVRISLENKLNT